MVSASKTSGDYAACSRCILDNLDDPQIQFDAHGICSYCRAYDKKVSEFLRQNPDPEASLRQIVEDVKKAGTGKPYDCILGVSGGVDSTYLAWKAKQFGLRPLAVHFDNGWNSELAVHNIEAIIQKLDLPLHTFVVEWEQFKDLQLAFLQASVVDIEVVTDHAIFAQLYRFALQYDIRYILSGTNFATEFVLPASWIHNKRDHIHIRAIHEQFGTKPMNTYPLFSSYLKWKSSWKGIQSISLLDYMNYNKSEVKEIISKELGWRDYGGKHYESVFTRFYQGYILPVKFGIDKRKAHLSNLICSGQISRAQALQELKLSAYPEDTKKQDYHFVLKKLGLSAEEFEHLMHLPVKKHADYPVETDIYQRIPFLQLLRSGWYLIRKIKRSLGS